LGIKSNELFSVADSPEVAIEQLQKAFLNSLDKKMSNLDQIDEFIDQV
jgi:hypothetical protein